MMVIFFLVLLVSSVQTIDLPEEWLPPLKSLCRALQERNVPGHPAVIDVVQTLELTAVHVSNVANAQSKRFNRLQPICFLIILVICVMEHLQFVGQMVIHVRCSAGHQMYGHPSLICRFKEKDLFLFSSGTKLDALSIFVGAGYKHICDYS